MGADDHIDRTGHHPAWPTPSLLEDTPRLPPSSSSSPRLGRRVMAAVRGEIVRRGGVGSNPSSLFSGGRPSP
jgi:hypothetical protein